MIHMYYDDGEGGTVGQLIFMLIVIAFLFGGAMWWDNKSTTSKANSDLPAKTIVYDTIQKNDSTFVLRPRKSN